MRIKEDEFKTNSAHYFEVAKKEPVIIDYRGKANSSRLVLMSYAMFFDLIRVRDYLHNL